MWNRSSVATGPTQPNFVARWPDLADELRAFIADYDRMNQAAAALCPAPLPPEQPPPR